MKVLLTGASGFVGSAVLQAAKNRKIVVRPVFRTLASTKEHPEATFVPSLDGESDWSQALKGVDVVLHVAAKTQVMREEALDALAEFRRVNLIGTSTLARQAAAAGVRRFVFISSIKVNGEMTLPDRPFTADQAPAPNDYYGVSKSEAETELMRISKETGMEVTVIRPPLIYGPGVKGNFSSLVSLVRRGLPLPLGCVKHNRRSLVGLDNLVDLILVCVDHPKAGNQTFLVSDGEDLSTKELLNRIGKALCRRTYLLWVPVGFLSLLLRLLGKNGISQRLIGSLQVDISKTCEMLDWKPKVTVDEGMRRVVG